jgi:NDP-sugar pyrophosphorylase family protein
MTQEIEIPVAILAGGLATRLRPLTDNIPKILVEVGGKPFLEHQLVVLREQGIRNVVLCVGFLGEAIRDRFGDGREYGVDIRYSFDGPSLLGTGGAIRHAIPMLGNVFFVLYGDSYLRIDFAAIASAFRQSGRSGLITVFQNQNSWDRSNVHFAEGEIKQYDKRRPGPEMRYIDYGLSMYRASVFARYADVTPLDLSEIMRDLAERGELAGYEAAERFYEIGSPAGLQELNRLLSAANR